MSPGDAGADTLGHVLCGPGVQAWARPCCRCESRTQSKATSPTPSVWVASLAPRPQALLEPVKKGQAHPHVAGPSLVLAGSRDLGAFLAPSPGLGAETSTNPPLQANWLQQILEGLRTQTQEHRQRLAPCCCLLTPDPRGTCFALMGPRQYLEVGKPQGASIHAGGAFVCFLMSNETGSGKACASNLCPWRSLCVHTHPPAPQRELSAPPPPPAGLGASSHCPLAEGPSSGRLRPLTKGAQPQVES